jgi:hypothetical protein
MAFLGHPYASPMFSYGFHVFLDGCPTVYLMVVLLCSYSSPRVHLMVVLCSIVLFYGSLLVLPECPPIVFLLVSHGFPTVPLTVFFMVPIVFPWLSYGFAERFFVCVRHECAKERDRFARLTAPNIWSRIAAVSSGQELKENSPCPRMDRKRTTLLLDGEAFVHGPADGRRSVLQTFTQKVIWLARSLG